MGSNLKIAHFVSNYPDKNQKGAYGKSLAVYNLCNYLAQKDHNVEVFTITSQRESYDEQYQGVKIHRCGSLFGYKSERFSYNILRRDLKYFDIIHIHSGISMCFFVGYKFSKKFKKPLVVTWHGDSIYEPEYGRYTGVIPRMAAAGYKPIADKILKDADSIISVSKSYIDKSTFLENHKEKIVAIPNGIVLSEFNYCSNKEECKKQLGFGNSKVVLFMASLYPLKGPHVLIKAIPKVVEQEKNVIFVFAGGGNINYYQHLSDTIGISKYIKFVGYITDNKSLYYQAADIFVLPSFLECFPLVNLEAMACGTPVIASDVGGVSDIVIDNKTGLLVPPEDSLQLADAIKELLQNEKKRKSMGINARELAENYSYDVIGDKTEKLYLDKVMSYEKN